MLGLVCSEEGSQQSRLHGPPTHLPTHPLTITSLHAPQEALITPSSAISISISTNISIIIIILLLLLRLESRPKLVARFLAYPASRFQV